MSIMPDDDMTDEQFMRDRAYEICYQRRQLQIRIEDLTKLVNRALVVTLPYHHDQKIAEVLVRMQKQITRIGKCFEWDDEKAARKTCDQLEGTVTELKGIIKGLGVPNVERLLSWPG